MEHETKIHAGNSVRFIKQVRSVKSYRFEDVAYGATGAVLGVCGDDVIVRLDGERSRLVTVDRNVLQVTGKDGGDSDESPQELKDMLLF